MKPDCASFMHDSTEMHSEISLNLVIRGGSRNFGKGGPVRGEIPKRAPKARALAGGFPRKFLKN